MNGHGWQVTAYTERWTMDDGQGIRSGEAAMVDEWQVGWADGVAML